MILVDSSVWIDYLTGRPSRQADHLDTILDKRPIGIPDLVLTEVLQGCRTDAEYRRLHGRMTVYPVVPVGGERCAVEAARHYRTLRTLGITIRKTIDTLIATRCILDGIPLLYSDRDFDPFVRHLGLIPVLEPASGVN
ncbi:PIN domain nuclease [Sphingomonas sp. GM_Shp_2]|uniref:type II toxin-antitoxin system VapC family toxin n=1 Tax=Sphingomonas sp. GM_Shp_2 TaxID=2937380 RepID=UPI00226A4C54|nr:PIN domain nuclease [Sphingomonas sp. GM_Shp_2]